MRRSRELGQALSWTVFVVSKMIHRRRSQEDLRCSHQKKSYPILWDSVLIATDDFPSYAVAKIGEDVDQSIKPLSMAMHEPCRLLDSRDPGFEELGQIVK